MATIRGGVRDLAFRAGVGRAACLAVALTLLVAPDEGESWWSRSLRDIPAAFVEVRDALMRAVDAERVEAEALDDLGGEIEAAMRDVAGAVEAFDAFLVQHRFDELIAVLEFCSEAQGTMLEIELSMRGESLRDISDRVWRRLREVGPAWNAVYYRLRAARGELARLRVNLPFQKERLLAARREVVRRRQEYLLFLQRVQRDFVPPMLSEVRVLAPGRPEDRRLLYHARWEHRGVDGRQSGQQGQAGVTSASGADGASWDEAIRRAQDIVEEFSGKRDDLAAVFAAREQALLDAKAEFEELDQDYQTSLVVEAGVKVLLDVLTEVKDAIETGGASAVPSVLWALADWPEYSFPALNAAYDAAHGDATGALARAEEAARELELRLSPCFTSGCAGDWAAIFPAGALEHDGAWRPSRAVVTAVGVAATSALHRADVSLVDSLAWKSGEIFLNPLAESVQAPLLRLLVEDSTRLPTAVLGSLQQNGTWATLMALGRLSGQEVVVGAVSEQAELVKEVFGNPGASMRRFGTQALHELSENYLGISLSLAKGMAITTGKSVLVSLLREGRHSTYFQAVTKELDLLWLRADLLAARRMEELNDELLAHFQGELARLLVEEARRAGAPELRVLVDQPLPRNERLDLALFVTGPVRQVSYGLVGEGEIRNVEARQEQRVFLVPLECVLARDAGGSSEHPESQPDGQPERQLVVGAVAALNGALLDGDPSTPVVFDVDAVRYAGYEPNLDMHHMLRFGGDAEVAGALGKPPDLRDPALDPLLPLEGNWIVEWEGLGRAFVTLSKGLRFSCEPAPGGGCWSHSWRPADATWRLVGQAEQAGPGAGLEWFEGKLELAGAATPAGGLGVDYWPYLGRHRERVALDPDRDVASGEWFRGEERGGGTRWMRAPAAAIHEMSLTTEREDRYRRPGAEPGAAAVELVYSEGTWRASNDVRGSRPRFFLTLWGEHLWGLHDPWIAPETGLELTGPRYACADGASWTCNDTAWANCEKGHGGVAGLSFEVCVWPRATPGRKLLYLDGTPLPFELVVRGFPGAESDRCSGR